MTALVAGESSSSVGPFTLASMQGSRSCQLAQAWGMWPLMAIYGVYMALTEGVGKALIADHTPSDCRGTAMGLFYGITGLTTLIASLSAGILWDRFGAPAALLPGIWFRDSCHHCASARGQTRSATS